MGVDTDCVDAIPSATVSKRRGQHLEWPSIVSVSLSLSSGHIDKGIAKITTHNSTKQARYDAGCHKGFG